MSVQKWISLSTHWRRKWPTAATSTETTKSAGTGAGAAAAEATTHSHHSRTSHRSQINSKLSLLSSSSSLSPYRTCFIPHRTQQWIYTLFLICLLILPSLASDSSWDDVRWNYEDYSQVTRVPLDPIFLPTKNNITVREGGNAALPCKIQHQGTKRAVWRRVDRNDFLTVGKLSLDLDRNLEVRHVKPSEELDEWTLILPKVRKDDAGLYECQVTTVGGHRTQVRLNVVGPRLTQPAVHMSGTRYVERGAQINLTCNATGGNRTADDVDWFKDGNIIGSGKDFVILKYTMIEQGALVSTLHVDRAKQEHAGTYVCRSSHGELGSLAVQVLVADSSNWKRDFPDNPPGTVASNHSSTALTLTSHRLHEVTFYSILIFSIAAIHYRGFHS